ncbi:MAG: hypothetical protein MJA27_29115, partial [Pseudanabaenales cyanobacterium]|nr:hypothetical protein [Pseudanabaenales cyanobacterium]
MIISLDTRIPFPRSLVYRTYRDKLIELLPYMPNVRHIEIKSHRRENGRTYCINEWRGGGEIPAVARAVISEDMLSWTEHNIWDEAEFSLEWRIKTHAYTEAVNCGGKNRFLEEGDSTVIENRGKLVIDREKLEGIPPFLRGSVASIVEDFLGKKVGPNLVQMGEGVREYLAR